MLAGEIPKSLVRNTQAFLNTYVIAVAGTSQTR